MQKVIKSFISGLSAKEKKVLNIACGVVCIALFDRLIIGPLTGESKSIEEKIASQTKLIEKNLLILRYKDKIIGEDESYEAFYTQKGFVQEELIASFLSEVEGLAKGANVALVNINPVNVEEQTAFVEYTLTIECAGKMEDLVTFIYNIDVSEKPIRTISYEILPKNRDNYEVKCILTVLKIIVIPDEELTVKVTIEEEPSSEAAGIGLPNSDVVEGNSAIVPPEK